MGRVWVAILAVSVGCASVPLKKADLAALARADGRLLEGCYDCLTEARATYERIAVGKARPLVIARLFEAELLIALREKELALDSSGALARAQRLAAELPPSAGASRYLALVDLVPSDNAGTPHREASAVRQAHASAVAGLNDELVWLRSATALREPARQYLSLAVDCAWLFRGRRSAPAPGAAADWWAGSYQARDAPPDLVPLVAYRIGMCDSVSARTLGQVRDRVPGFVEAAFFLGRLEGADAAHSGGRKAKDLLAEAYARFPNSPSVTYFLGNLNQVVGNCREALRYYDETLVIKSAHEDALLGRTMCLTYLKRTDEAIAEATHMIDLQTDNWGEAYYWRAWNHHFREELAPARADVQRAKSLSGSMSSYTLAGIIEHDQDDLEPAVADLVRAKLLGRGRNCIAMWYLGLVMRKQEKWIDSGGNFSDAMACYDADVRDDLAGMSAMQGRTDLDADFKAAQIAGFEAALKEDRSHYYASAFNAANHYTRGGNLDQARKLVEIAAADPALADVVAQLREILKR
jgi:tetratricopeptide (TPR) repeat protein